MRIPAPDGRPTPVLVVLQDAPFVLDKSTFFKGAKRKRASAAGAVALAGCWLHLQVTCAAAAHCPADHTEYLAILTAGDAGAPQPDQRPSSAGARPPPAAAAAATPRANEGVLADDDGDDINVFGQFQYGGPP